jgi:hypothetical protein
VALRATVKFSKTLQSWTQTTPQTKVVISLAVILMIRVK